MPVKEAIIIAGGLGTRLQRVMKDIPKPMAPVGGRPFLELLISHLKKSGIEKVVLAIGYKAEVVREYFNEHPQKIIIDYSIESEPLGTGGCVKKAFNLISSDRALVLNGDTLFDIDVQELYKRHIEAHADLTLALNKMPDCSRYGTVELDKNMRIIGFCEKGKRSVGNINGGVYILNKRILNKMPDKFSFEKDFLTAHYKELNFYGHICNGYFIDIGIPEDYEKAQKELS